VQVLYSSQQPAGAVDSSLAAALREVSPDRLRCAVEALARPRHYVVQRRANEETADWIAHELTGPGYAVHFQGSYRNVVATRPAAAGEPALLVGAHYDSVPETPGADDNASAVAAMLECARVVARNDGCPRVCFVAFNREEDGLLGSADFVANYLPGSSLTIVAAHVLEMVGYSSSRPGSQRLPQGLPIRVPSTGDFLGILGNRDSAALVDRVLGRAVTYCPELAVIGLTVPAGAELLLPVLARSDHAPFWQAGGIPAVMWTDTAEFRNPHYHRSMDTPETLDYEFLACVTRVLLACLLSADSSHSPQG
jgi:hypothetical protein